VDLRFCNHIASATGPSHVAGASQYWTEATAIKVDSSAGADGLWTVDRR